MLTSQHTDTALALSEPNLDTSPSTRTLGDQTKYSGSRVKEVQTLAHSAHCTTAQDSTTGQARVPARVSRVLVRRGRVPCQCQPRYSWWW